MTKKHLNRDPEQSDIKLLKDNFDYRLSVMGNTLHHIHTKLDRLEENQKHLSGQILDLHADMRDNGTHIHIVLKRIEKLLEHVLIIEGYDLDKLKY